MVKSFRILLVLMFGFAVPCGAQTSFSEIYTVKKVYSNDKLLKVEEINTVMDKTPKKITLLSDRIEEFNIQSIKYDTIDQNIIPVYLCLKVGTSSRVEIFYLRKKMVIYDSNKTIIYSVGHIP